MPDGWNVIAASVIGVSHEKAALPCQDAHRWVTLPDGTLLVAVADGAGSAALGELGAAVAVDCAIRTMVRRAIDGHGGHAVDLDALANVLQAARASLETEAACRQADLRELACTLILTTCGPNGVVAAQVGDGAVIAAGSAGRLVAVTRPPEAEYANETTFLISDEYLATAQFVQCPDRTARLAVFTDGLQRLALNFPQGEPHAPFFEPLFRFAAAATDLEAATVQLAQFLKSPRIVERADDDLTLLLATGRE
jgi:hypothetical protein